MTKPPILFIHGMWGTPAHWQPLVDHYRAHGHVCVAPALPYHDIAPGDPPPQALGRIGIQDYVDFLAGEARGLEATPVLVGHSMGAMLAQAVAQTLAPPGLVLLSPAPTAAVAQIGLSQTRTLLGVTTRGGWWKSPTRIDPARARWGIYNSVPTAIADAEIAALVWDSGRVLFQMAMPWADATKASRVDYARLTMPALVMVGDHDRITPIALARATARRLPGAVDYRELAGVGHWLFHTPVVERVIAETDAFLARAGLS